MSKENIDSGHPQESISNSSVRTLCEEVNFTARYYESELQSVARESCSLNVTLRELKRYTSVLSQGGGVALHRGEALMSAQLSERVENLFTHRPEVEGPHKSRRDIVLWAGPVPNRVCSATQLTVGDTRIELNKDDLELLCSGRPWEFLSPWPFPGDFEKELQVVEETLADVRKIKDMVNKVMSEASTLEQHLSTRRDLLSHDRINKSCTTSADTAIICTPQAGSRNPYEIWPPHECEITAYPNADDAHADIQASRFANSVIPKHDRALIVSTKVVAMDLSEEQPNGSNTQSLHKSPMNHGSTPLGRTDRSNPMMATVNASPRGTSIANIITIPGTESITSTNERRYMPVLFHRLATAMNDQQNERIIRWSEDGNNVVIVNEQVLTTKLLPAFNIPNYFSFTQQLEKLGFRRVEQGYEHPYFTRDITEGQFHSIRGNDRKSLPSSSTDYQMIWPSDVANLRTPSSNSVTETSAGDGSVWSSPSDIQPLSARHGAPSRGVSCGINYRVAKLGRKSKAPHVNRAV